MKKKFSIPPSRQPRENFETTAVMGSTGKSGLLNIYDQIVLY